MGKRGSLAFDGKKYYRQIPKTVDAIDTLGAGDSFTTAFLLSLLDGEKIETAMEKGAEFAAKDMHGERLLLDTAFRLRIRSLVTACKNFGIEQGTCSGKEIVLAICLSCY